MFEKVPTKGGLIMLVTFHDASPLWSTVVHTCVLDTQYPQFPDHLIGAYQKHGTTEVHVLYGPPIRFMIRPAGRY